MSDTKYVYKTSWGLPVQMGEVEFHYYVFVDRLRLAGVITKADFLSAEARMLRYGFLNNAGRKAA